MLVACKNCNHSFEGSYCSQCGQRATNGRIYIKDLREDFLNNVLSLEGPLPQTIWALMRAPGQLVQTYISGRRRHYYQPVKYFILMLTLHLVVTGLLGYNPVKSQIAANGQDLAHAEAAVSVQAGYFMSKHINLFLPVYILLLSGFSCLFFRKSPYNYPEFMTFFFFVIGQYLLLVTCIIPLTFIAPDFFLLTYFIKLFYTSWALASFTSGTRFKRGLKSFFTVFLSFFAYVSVSFGIAVLIILFW